MNNTKLIALSAISTAFATIFLTLGTYFSFLDLPFALIASVFVMLPLYLKSYWGSFLSYLATAVLTFIFAGFNIYALAIPVFLLLFGIYPLCRLFFAQKGYNALLCYLLQGVWCVGVEWFILWYYLGVCGQNLDKILSFIGGYQWLFYLLFAVFTVLFYVVYDRAVNTTFILMDKYMKKIIK